LTVCTWTVNREWSLERVKHHNHCIWTVNREWPLERVKQHNHCILTVNREWPLERVKQHNHCIWTVNRECSLEREVLQNKHCIETITDIYMKDDSYLEYMEAISFSCGQELCLYLDAILCTHSGK